MFGQADKQTIKGIPERFQANLAANLLNKVVNTFMSDCSRNNNETLKVARNRYAYFSSLSIKKQPMGLQTKDIFAMF